MELATAAASAAATAAALGYLEAKFHFRKDLTYIRGRRLQRKLWEQAVKEKRTSPYYLVESNARENPDYEAIWSRAGCYTRKEVYDRANQYAQWFLSQGVRPGDLVAFFMINSPDFMTAWIGLLAIGAAPAMINFHLTSKALLHCLSISGAKLIIIDGPPDAHERIAGIQTELDAEGYRVVDLETNRSQVYALDARRPGDELREGVQAHWPLAMFYTSGTTGLPKACNLPTVVAYGHGVGSRTGLNPVDRPDQRYYVCMPYYHGTGGINAMAQLLAGTTICIAPKFSVSGFWKDIRDSRATWFVYVGETLRYLLASPPSADDKVHNVNSIYGNGLRPDVWDRFRDRFGIERIHEFFNSTEGVFPLDNVCRGDFLQHAVGHHGLLLRLKYYNEYIPVAIDADTGDIARDPKTGFAYRVPYHIGGEVLIRTPGERVFGGYVGNPEATEKKMVRDVFSKGDCFYRTGDALRRDDDGRWYFLDRLGDTFRWKGENVSTAEVSEVLGKFPGVLEANVYGVDLPGHDGKAGAAAIYVDPQQRAHFNHSKFLEHARKHLPRYAVPVFVRLVQQVSATHNNKQNKVPLKNEGVHPDKVAAEDQILWIDGHGKGTTYIPFARGDWEDLHAGKARL
ncbi:fatty acid transporter [Ophiostoma piceae UAMH 11346]|uniref:Very long-chain fatty acid transport protein n=1 Tax=Ophiostoma piceae (strain UAMH 11346) TaxID=1262450 RepID=S3CTI6_OPHP1|nr:fatty acid transporter [Ophiostoma piceae UAMH 11346]